MKKSEVSHIQKQFWVLQQLYPETTAYNIPYLTMIEGDLNINALEEAVSSIVARYDMLRSHFNSENETVFQYVVNKQPYIVKIEAEFHNLHFSDNPLPNEITKVIHETFNLKTWPLFRIRLFVYSNVSALIIVFHHIIVDLVSINIFFKELSELYRSICKKDEPDLNDPKNNYPDYSDWLKKWLSTENAQKKIDEWRNYITTKPEKLSFPTKSIQTKIINSEGRRVHLTVDNITSARITSFAEENSVNDFIVLLSAYAIFLNKICNQSNIIIGIPFKNRRKPEFNNTFGCFVNILPLLVSFDEYLTGKALMKQVLKNLFLMNRIEDIPFLLLNSLLGQSNGTGILQAGFTFDPGITFQLSGVEAKSQYIEREGAQLDIFFSLWENDGKYNCYLEYSTKNFNNEMVEGFWKTYCAILSSFIYNPEKLICELDIVSDEDLDYILRYNKTETEYEEDLCIHEKFEKQVKKTPDEPALLFEDMSITYRELDENSNRIANRLIKEGINVEDVVCICLERSVNMIIGIFGILKAGAAYLPLNPKTPCERLKGILLDAKPKLILTTKSSSLNLPHDIQQLFLDNILSNPLSGDNCKPEVEVCSRNLAYIIYTSGSTGVPKGVMIEHHSVLNRLGWMQKEYPIDQSDTLIQKTPITFDVSVWELFWWSFYGSKLLILPNGAEKSPETIAEYIEKYNVTTIHFVPSMFLGFFDMLNSRNTFNKLVNLKWLFMSGEALPLRLVEDFNKLRMNYKLPRIINLYGPTEATVDVSYFNCPSNNVLQIFIGKPIDNTKLYVLNNKMKIQPVGLTGELVISGVNLARGYLNDPELTCKKFFNFIITDTNTVRAYRTGDLAKLTSNGEIEYIGRLDNQVKIRGFRIELGDVEAHIHDHPDVKNCAVITSENDHSKHLIAYIFLKPGKAMKSEAMRKYLSLKLPDYMIPSFFIFLDKFPLTDSGKLNRRALLIPESSLSDDEIVPPANNYEKILREIWGNILKIKNISCNENFFEIGGNSLLAINLAAQISKNFNISFDTLKVFGYPNIKVQSELIAELKCPKDGFTINNLVDEKIKNRKGIDFHKRRNFKN